MMESWYVQWNRAGEYGLRILEDGGHPVFAFPHLRQVQGFLFSGTGNWGFLDGHVEVTSQHALSRGGMLLHQDGNSPYLLSYTDSLGEIGYNAHAPAVPYW